MALNFPISPTNGQVYYDPTSGNRYIYDSSSTTWRYAANNDSISATLNNQVIYNNNGGVAGSSGLTFSFDANTLYTNTINVSQNVTSQYYYGNGAFLTGIVTDFGPAFNAANQSGVIANAAFSSANTSGSLANQAGVIANAAFSTANTALIPKINISGTPPTNNVSGNLWWNSNTGKLLIYYADADSSQWVDAFTAGGLANSGVTASTYGGSTNIPVLVVDTYGRITTAANVAVQGMDYAYANGVANSANAWANTNFATIANATAAFAKANTSVQNNTTTLISTGYTISSYNAGGNVAAYTTWTPNAANGNYQYANSNGSFTLAAPANDCAIDILFINGQGGAGSGAGAITFSGFTVGTSTGDTYATTANNKYLLSIRRVNSISTYLWKALQ